MALFIGSEIYRGSTYGAKHPLAIPRVSTVMDLARALGWLPPSVFRTSPRAKPQALLAYHTPAYIEALQRAESTQAVDPATRDTHGLGTLSNPVFPEMFRRPATGVGGAMLAAELVQAGGVVHVPGAGTHHALPNRANGFCYLNDPVLCLMHLRRLGLRRIAYIDIDAHHPDGVEPAFAGDRDMLMMSVHEENRWPRTGALTDTAGGSALNMPVPRGFNDTEMAAARDYLVLPALERFRPEAVVLQSGSDAIEEDPLSRLSLSNTAHAEIVRALMAQTDRLIVMGGGGYNPWSVARCWVRNWAVIAGHDIPDRLPPQAEVVLRALRWPDRAAGRNPPEHWFTTLADAPRPGPLRPEVWSRILTLRDRIKGL